MIYLGAFGYAAVAVCYAVVTMLLLAGWRGVRLGGLLIVACAVSAVWGGTLGLQAYVGAASWPVLLLVEALRGGLWIAFLATLLGRLGGRRELVLGSHFIWIAYPLAGLGTWLATLYAAPNAAVGTVMIWGGLLLALTGLVLVEQLYRNSAPDARWSLKPLVLGVGGMFAYDLYLYSQALLFDAIDITAWYARGVVNVMFVPLIAIAARRNPRWDLDIFVSRQVVFYTGTLVAVGTYLLVMSAGGYAILIYGGSWGGLAQLVFFVGAVLVLVVLLFSSSLRARFRVFLSKHFFRNKYDYREEWLRLVSTLSGFERSSTREIVIRAIAQIVGSPAGFLWLKDETAGEYRLVAACDAPMSLPNIPLDEPMIAFIDKYNWLIDLEEYAGRPDMYENVALPEWLAANREAWLIVPLVTRQEVLGLVLLYRAPGPRNLNYEDRDLLKTVGHHIAVHLAQENADSLLAQARQFETYNRLTAFLMHDLNNLIAQQSLIIKNAERHKRNPEFVDDAMQTIANSVDRMKQIMDQLKRRDKEPTIRKTRLKAIVSAAVDRCDGRKPAVQVHLEPDDLSLEVDSERFIMILTHLIRNAQDATPQDGEVRVVTASDNGLIRISVTDTGCGMTPEFVRERLFRPFDSTKGSQGMGIGAYQAREFARSLGGDLKVESDVGSGTRVVMSFPQSG